MYCKYISTNRRVVPAWEGVGASLEMRVFGFHSLAGSIYKKTRTHPPSRTRISSRTTGNPRKQKILPRWQNANTFFCTSDKKKKNTVRHPECTNRKLCGHCCQAFNNSNKCIPRISFKDRNLYFQILCTTNKFGGENETREYSFVVFDVFRSLYKCSHVRVVVLLLEGKSFPCQDRMFLKPHTPLVWRGCWIGLLSARGLYADCGRPHSGHTEIVSAFVIVFAFPKTGERSRVRLRIRTLGVVTSIIMYWCNNGSRRARCGQGFPLALPTAAVHHCCNALREFNSCLVISALSPWTNQMFIWEQERKRNLRKKVAVALIRI